MTFAVGKKKKKKEDNFKSKKNFHNCKLGSSRNVTTLLKKKKKSFYKWFYPSFMKMTLTRSFKNNILFKMMNLFVRDLDGSNSKDN